MTEVVTDSLGKASDVVRLGWAVGDWICFWEVCDCEWCGWGCWVGLWMDDDDGDDEDDG